MVWGAGKFVVKTARVYRVKAILVLIVYHFIYSIYLSTHAMYYILCIHMDLFVWNKLIYKPGLSTGHH